MSGKILIYGGAGGIGSATARILAEKGFGIHLVGRTEEPLAALAHELNVAYTVGDVTDGTLFERVTQESAGPLEGLVYAVGTINLRSLQRSNVDDMVLDFRVNALGAALAIQAALPALKKSDKSASVVLFSSVATVQGFSLHTSVGMAKGAVNGLTLSLASELAPKIRVNAIAPSLTRTPLAAGILANDRIAASLAEMHPLQRLGSANDVARLASFLLSPDADWITGQIISVDGGRSTLRMKN